jgi:zinc protease
VTAIAPTVFRKAAAGALLAIALLASLVAPTAATTIERVVSPSGIEAWLVRDTSVPLVAMDFAFRGGTSQDFPGKGGLASMVAGLLDEGAGDIDSRSFHERLENKAIELGFTAGRDQLSGSVRTLVEHKDEAFELLRLSLTAPRFEQADIERIRNQMLSLLRRESMDPNDIAYKNWWAAAFANHPYGRPVRGTPESIAAIAADDLRTYVRNTFARDTLKVSIVGNIDAVEAGVLVDKVFGQLPAKALQQPVADEAPQQLGRRIVVDTDVPQSVVVIGGAGIPRKDPDFMAGYVLNHVLGGGTFSSRLYREVREVRGLAYSVFSMLVPLRHTALFMSSTATRADRAGQTLDVVEGEMRRLAAQGPTADELAKAKSYLKGSYALNFDTSSKIASQLVAIQLDDLGIDYINKRNDMVEAVGMEDVRRVAKRLLDGGMLVTVIGRSPPVTPAKSPSE